MKSIQQIIYFSISCSTASHFFLNFIVTIVSNDSINWRPIHAHTPIPILIFTHNNTARNAHKNGDPIGILWLCGDFRNYWNWKIRARHMKSKWKLAVIGYKWIPITQQTMLTQSVISRGFGVCLSAFLLLLSLSSLFCFVSLADSSAVMEWNSPMEWMNERANDQRDAAKKKTTTSESQRDCWLNKIHSRFSRLYPY